MVMADASLAGHSWTGLSDAAKTPLHTYSSARLCIQLGEGRVGLVSQLERRPLFKHSAFAEHNDAVAVHHRVKAMGDGEHGGIVELSLKRFL